jgi:hypothetical protein
MDKMIKIRNEEEKDYKTVEEITRKSFWNLYIPGCCNEMGPKTCIPMLWIYRYEEID